MQELLIVPRSHLTRESNGGGVIWAPNDAFPQVMGPERHGWGTWVWT